MPLECACGDVHVELISVPLAVVVFLLVLIAGVFWCVPGNSQVLKAPLWVYSVRMCLCNVPVGKHK